MNRFLVALATTAITVSLLTPAHAVEDKQRTGEQLVMDIAPVRDSYISEASPAQTPGNSEKLIVNGDPRWSKSAYLAFDVPQFDAGTLLEVELRLRRDVQTLPETLSLWLTTDGWTEGNLSYRSAPALAQQVATARPNSRKDPWATFSLNNVITSPGTYAFAVRADRTGAVARFWSRESDRAPVLRITTSSASNTPEPNPPADACGFSKVLEPTCGLLWGNAPGAFTDTPRAQAHRQFENATGRTVGIYHMYYRGDQLFPTAAERVLAREPGKERVLFLNWKVAAGMTWSDVADGRADQRIDRLAAHIAATFPEKFFLAVHHEPENDVNPATGSGMTASDYRNMFRHTVERLRARGVTNAIIVMDYMGYPNWMVKPWFNDLYPGDDVVDWVGWNPYAFGRPSGWGAWDFRGLVTHTNGLQGFRGAYEYFSRMHPNKPLMLGEWGVAEYWDDLSVSQKAWFYGTVRDQVAEFPRLKALVHFDTPRSAQRGLSTAVRTTSGSLRAFRELSTDPRFVNPPAGP